MTSIEEVSKILSSASPDGMEARALVVETARVRRFMNKGIIQQELHELEAMSVLDLRGRNSPEWTVAYQFELGSAIEAMKKALDLQQVCKTLLYSSI